MKRINLRALTVAFATLITGAVLAPSPATAGVDTEAVAGVDWAEASAAEVVLSEPMQESLTITRADGRVVSAPTKVTVFPPSGEQTMSPSHPSWNFSDANGRGSVQIAYRSHPYAIELGYRLSPAVFALCDNRAGLTESLTLTSTRGKTVATDHHANEDCNYWAHPIFRIGVVAPYQMHIVEVFPVVVDGASGTGTLRAQANFRITK